MVEAEELLRLRVRTLKGKRTQRSLAKAIGVSDTNMSDFLAGKQGLGLDKLAPLARELDTSVADLFVVQESAGMTTSGVNSVHGRADDQARLLEQQLAERDQEIRALRIAITDASDQLRELAGVARPDVRRAQRSKPKSR